MADVQTSDDRPVGDLMRDLSQQISALVRQETELAKAELRTRPIFHRTDAAIRGHVFCSFLALVLRKELADRFVAQGRTPPAWNRLAAGRGRSGRGSGFCQRVLRRFPVRSC